MSAAREISRNGKKARVWLPAGEDELESGVRENVDDVLQYPYLAADFALMPDHHPGYGVPIGSILPTKEAVSPYAIGVDIGCGMAAYKTSVHLDDHPDAEDKLGYATQNIRERVPLGPSSKNRPTWLGEQITTEDAEYLVRANRFDIGEREFSEGDVELTRQFWEEAMYKHAHQLGTLGGGNHFIELQRDWHGDLWVMVHSGSRNLGYRLCNLFTDLAEQLCDEPEEMGRAELAPLLIDSYYGETYLKVHDICFRAAKRNRADMLHAAVSELDSLFGTADAPVVEEWANRRIDKHERWSDGDEDGTPFDMVHNFGRFEEHDGERFFLHRKGAATAFDNQLVIVPGSMDSISYICRGKGNPEAYNSSAHGAGRVMGRREAKKKFSDRLARTDTRHIITGFRPENSKDELGRAYKNINEVLEAQSDMVDVLYRLEPLAVIKG